MQDTLRDQCDPTADCLRNCCTNGIVAPLYFVVFVLLAQFVLVNVVVAVLMKHLEESHKYMEEDEDAEIDLEIAREIEREKEEEMLAKEAEDKKKRKEKELKYLGKKKKKSVIKVSSLPKDFTYSEITDAKEKDDEAIEISDKDQDANNKLTEDYQKSNKDALSIDSEPKDIVSVQNILNGVDQDNDKPKITITSSVTSMALSGHIFTRADNNSLKLPCKRSNSQKQRPVIMIDDTSSLDADAISISRLGDSEDTGCLSPRADSEHPSSRKWSDVTMIDEDTANISSYLITSYPELDQTPASIGDIDQNGDNVSWKGAKDGSLSSISTGSLSN